MLFNETDNFIEVYNNSSFFCGRIDHLASSVIKFRRKNSVPKHCIRSLIIFPRKFSGILCFRQQRSRRQVVRRRRQVVRRRRQVVRRRRVTILSAR